MAGPVEGIKVVELGVWVAGPAAGGILADWGADVIKIEPPAGDPGRMFGLMLGCDLGVNPPFEMDNRSKRSVVLDLTTEADLGIAFELLSDADVFVTNLRPGALRRLSLDFESVSARNPSLVYGLITGYGQTGPDADRAAYDVAAFWSRAGLAHLLTRPGDTPPFQRGGMGDHSAGMTLVAAICAALVARERTGTGQLVTTSLYRQGAYTVSFDLNTYLLTGPADSDRATRDHGQPVHEQLRRLGRAAILDRRARCRPALAAVVSCRRPSRVVDRPPVRRPPCARRQCGAAGRRSWTRSSRPGRSRSGRRSSRANRTSSGHRSTASRTSWPMSSSTPRAESSTSRTESPASRWSPHPRISMARRGRRVLRHRNSDSTPTKSSPNSRCAGGRDRLGQLYKFPSKCHAVW